MKILGLVDDLFLIAKVEGAISKANLSIKFLSAEDILKREFDYVIVDMEHEDAFNVIEKFPDKALCFGSHVKTDLFQKAGLLGCKRVFARSVFFDKLSELLR
ncbi:MAG: hypothetical protein HY831_04955 [Candidatus Aenigmarchaeota archaeon]|nr:hypothetical protein [Candidatus Aenigmarchaeota archaeon]